ncbi:MAG: hypothetical protein ACRDSE_12210 [Pseudonocardiaceae bacterium]
MRALVELVVPDDRCRFITRVHLNSDWVGDLLFSSVAERDLVLSALTAGDVHVVTRTVPRADLSIVEAAHSSAERA